MTHEHDVVVGEQPGVQSHSSGEQSENFAIRFRVAERRNRRLIQRYVVVPVSEVNVPVLELRRRWQDDVGIVCCVSLEMLEHHREQILARHPSQHGVAIRRDRRGVGVVHDQCADGRSADTGVWSRQCFAQADHVDGADRR